MKTLALSLAAVLMATTAQAQSSGPIDPARLSAIVKVLASDEFEGRSPGSPGEQKTVDYLIGQFQALKLEPAGDKGGWTQEVQLQRLQVQPGAKLSVSVGGKVTPLEQAQQINVATLRPVDHVTIAGAPMVFVGYGVKAPERGWDDFKGHDLKGKVAVFLINDPDFEAKAGEPVAGKFGGQAAAYYARWTYKYEEAVRQGAIAALIVHETPGAGYGWSTVAASNGESFDIVRADPAKDKLLLQGWLARDTAVDLFKQAGLDFEALKTSARSADFKPVPLTGAAFSADYGVTHSQVTSRNVLAKLTGASKPAQSVMFSAHWDAFGLGAPVNGDKVRHGAADDAIGVAGVLEIARAFTKIQPQPKRSILFLMVTAEEQGLLGSQYYSLNPLYPLARTAANINVDGVNQWGRTKDLTVVGMGASTLDDYLRTAAAEQGRTLRADPEPEKGFYYRSDHFNFAKQGVPALAPDAGIDYIGKSAEYGKKKRDEYTDVDYHAPSDQIKPDWDLAGALEDAQLFFAVGYRVANADAFPEWAAGNEFKAKRDESLKPPAH